MNQHTPGKWHIDTGTSRHLIVARERLIASIWQHYDRNNKAGELATDAANALLIAASPSLYAAAKLALDVLAVQYEDGTGTVKADKALHAFGALRQAVEQAEGREGK